ncbi:Gfo/Idh/MocA family oxidoreductase [soil metagenome]
MMSRMNRRRFLKSAAATAGAGYFYSASAVSAARAASGPNDKIHFASIGVGGKGDGDCSHAGSLGEMVAICDVDERNLNNKAKAFTSAKKYTDYRKLLEEMGKNIDAVTVRTPDHSHAPASIMAMKMKKHVYCQKPLTHTVFEARQMREIAKKMGVATQMGNQGSAESGLRRAVELVQSGLIGPVKEAHVWTNRPVWPQAPGVVARPPEKPTPEYLHWEEFIGPAPMRPYAEYPTGRRKGAYHDFNWRGWWDFGTGALGDMACHTANMAFRALKLGYPTSVIAEATDVNPETYPSSAKIIFQFPAREDMPAVTFNWYEGQRNGKKVLPPQELVEKAVAMDTDPKHKKNGKTALVDSGSILVGEKGILYSPDDYGAQFYLSPAEEFKSVNRTKPEKTAINGKGDRGMKIEWVEAMKGGPAPYSNFDFAAMLTEAILLGNIAIKNNGELLNWDGPNLKFTNSAKANEAVHYEYRKGWTL